MRDADKPKFLAVLNGLAAVKPGAKLTPESLELWWQSMQGWSIEDFRAAAAELVKRHEFFPNPFHFEQIRKATDMSAGEAWAIARDVIRSGGSSSGDPRTDAAIRILGGYGALGRTNSDQFQFLERRFCDHYEELSDRIEVREALPNFTKRLPYDPTRSLT